MSKLSTTITISILILLVSEQCATTTLFLQAITSALATIPFTGGPMTTGLVGAKLAIGTKLLYFLGYFGRRSKPVATIPNPAKQSTVGVGNTFTGAAGFQPLPLPYMLAGAGQSGQFQQFGNGFGVPTNYYQGPYNNFDPVELFQALSAQGYDANTAMQMMNYGAFAGAEGPGGFGVNPSQVGAFPQVFQPNAEDVQDLGVADLSNKPQSSGESVSQNQDLGSEDIESFFAFLRDMDENTCISRLVCDIGDNPSFLGDFSENIHSIIRSLDVQTTSGASQYIDIMEIGRKEGGCAAKFTQCSDSAYEIVKNVAPSVGVPQNI